MKGVGGAMLCSHFFWFATIFLSLEDFPQRRRVWKPSLKSQGNCGKGKDWRRVLHGLGGREAVGRGLALALHRLHHQPKVVPGDMISRLQPERKVTKKSTLREISSET